MSNLDLSIQKGGCFEIYFDDGLEIDPKEYFLFLFFEEIERELPFVLPSDDRSTNDADADGDGVYVDQRRRTMAKVF